MTSKTFIFAVHALSYNKMKEKVKEGKMPNFRELMENGSYGISKSVFSTSSAVDYISMITGCTPATHGIYDFQTNTIDESMLKNSQGKDALDTTDPGELEETRLFTSYDVEVPWIWEMMDNERAIQFGLFSPATFPAPEIPKNGIWVSGYWNRPEPYLRENVAASNNPDVRKTLIDEYEDYQMTPLMAIPPAYPDVDTEIEYLRKKLETDKKLAQRTQNARMKVLEEEEWDVFLTEEFFCDNIQHLLWPHNQENELFDEEVDTKLKEEDLLGEYYRHVDKLLGQYREKLDEDVNIIIISAHGQQESSKGEYMHENFHKLLEYGIWKPPAGWSYKDKKPNYSPHNRAEHNFNGVYIASGPDFQKGKESKSISCMDFTPLLLELYNYEKPKHLEGSTPDHILTGERS